MPKYEIRYGIDRWYNITIEAENEEEARRLFWKDEIDYQTNPPTLVGEQLADFIEVVSKEESNV
jgi:hypothetical protein